MHCWGDEWFKKYGDQLNSAISILETRMRKWAKVGVCGKEKWGCYRDDFLTFWDGGIKEIFVGYRATYKWHWFHRLCYHIDHRLIPVKKTEYGWIWVGLCDFNSMIGLRKLVNMWQARMINKAFQITLKENPEIIDELVSDVDCYEVIKPCKWGDVDGKEIHNKYWKVISKKE